MAPNIKAAVAMAFWTTLFASAGAGATPLDDVIPQREGAGACFARVYDDAHLRRNPQQKTASMLVWLSYRKSVVPQGGLTLSIGLGMTPRRDKQSWFSTGECRWASERDINRDVQGKRLIASFKKPEGIGCHMSARPDVFDKVSAEEGGEFVIDPAPGGRSLTLHLPDGLMMVRAADRARPVAVDFGRDDRVFLLHRAEPAACEAARRVMTR